MQGWKQMADATCDKPGGYLLTTEYGTGTV
jgi:hypothetical protein